VLAPLQRNSVPELLAAIGEGSVIQRAVLDVLNKLEEDAKPKSGFNLLRFSPKKLKESKNESSMPIKGLIPGVALHFAGCCNPIPGDEIVGVVNTGRGVTIHIKDCDILETFAETPERMIAVSWEEASKNMFTSRVKVTLANEIGSLADTTSTIARSKANVVNVKVVGRSLDFFELLIDIEVKDSNHLSSIISSLRTLNVVHSVERVRG
jgi:GTP pyrophosphokinase